MAVWRRRKRQVSDSSGPGVGAEKDRLRGPRGANVTARGRLSLDKGVVAKKDGKAFRTNRAEVATDYLVADAYDLRLLEGQEISSTGLLEVLELVAREPRSGLPGFIGRWDQKAGALDRCPRPRRCSG